MRGLPRPGTASPEVRSRVVRGFPLRGTSGPCGFPYLDPLSRAPLARLELAASRSTTGCSDQLSYKGVVLVWKVVQAVLPRYRLPGLAVA